MSKPSLYLGDWGTTFRATIVGQDRGAVISLDGTVTFRFVAPNGAVTDFEGTIVAASRGLCEYTTEPGLINATGTWRWQPIVHNASGDWAGAVQSFTVVARL